MRGYAWAFAAGLVAAVAFSFDHVVVRASAAVANKKGENQRANE